MDTLSWNPIAGVWYCSAGYQVEADVFESAFQERKAFYLDSVCSNESIASMLALDEITDINYWDDDEESEEETVDE